MPENLSLTIREEEPADYEAVESVIQQAFALAKHSDGIISGEVIYPRRFME